MPQVSKNCVASSQLQSLPSIGSGPIASRTRSKTTTEAVAENEETDSGAQQIYLMITSSLIGETMLLPQTFEQAMCSQQSEQWKNATKEEIASLYKNRTS